MASPRIKIQSLRRSKGPAKALELGDLCFEGDGGKVSSEQTQPDQGMMIYLAIPELVAGVADVASGEKATFAFIGADSSFNVLFKASAGVVTVSSRETTIATLSFKELKVALRKALGAFVRDEINIPAEDDISFSDLQDALDFLGIAIGTPKPID